MTKRLPWGHESRYCRRCSKVGPRCIAPDGIGWVHFYCLTNEEKKQRRAKQQEKGREMGT